MSDDDRATMARYLELHGRILQLESAIGEALHAHASGSPDVGDILRAGIGAESLARFERIRTMTERQARIDARLAELRKLEK
jgi:hypothetical protein